MFGTNYMRQHDTRDCAAACLASVCNLYGVKIPLIRMRELLKVDKNGSSMYALSEAAGSLGFQADVLEGEWQEFIQGLSTDEIQLPAICHMYLDGLEHFVIIKKINDKAVWLFDPGRGHVKCTHSFFQSQWTGYVLNISPTEMIKKQNFGQGNFRRYAEILLNLRWTFVGILFLSFIIAGASVAYSYAYQKVIDQFVLQGDSSATDFGAGLSGSEILLGQAEEMFQHLPYLFGIMILVVLMQFAFALVRGSLLAYVGKSVDTELSKQYIFKLLRLPFSYFQQWETGEIMGRYQDMNFIRDAISGSVLTITFETVMAVAGFIILIRINTTLFLIIMIMMAVYLMVVLLYRRPMRHMNREIMEADAKVTSGIKEGIDGIDVVKLFSQEESYGKKVMDRMENFIALCYKGSIIYVSQSELLSVIQGIGMVFVLWRGTVCVMQGDMTLGTLFLFVSLMDYFISPVKNLIGLQPQFQEAWIATDRLNDVLEAMPEKSSHVGNLDVSDLRGEIRYQNVSFRYGYRRWIFEDITFSIEEGEHVALTGANGSGKSTLARLLVGMYEPEYGIITVDNHNIKELELDCIRKHIVYVPQTSAILSGTIREGILFGSKRRGDDSAFTEIANGCFLDEMIRDNPSGYEWILTENGTNISGGHRQRIAIARALLAEPDVLILDEATSQIDRERELDILDFVFRYRAGRTVIVITHDEKIIEKCDREICIGEIVS